MTSSLYKVRVYSNTYEPRLELSTWQHLGLYIRVNEPGSIDLDMDYFEGIWNDFDIDGIIEVYRKIPNVRDWYKIHEGHIRRTRLSASDTGRMTFSVYAVGFIELLDRRVILYKAGHPRTTKSGPGETVIKEFVIENIGCLARTVDGRLRNGVISNFDIERDAGNGKAWSGSRAYKRLYDTVSDIASATGIDFSIIGVSGRYLFRCHNGQLGKNRTYTGITDSGRNMYGNIPIVFSVQQSNISEISYTYDRTQESNVVIVLGQGQEEERNVAIRFDADAINVSPINTREITKDARTQSTNEALTSTAEETLFNKTKFDIVDFSPSPSIINRYGIDFDVGDIVTASFFNRSSNVKITGADISVDREAEQINFSMETLKEVE
ncbi:MAG: hypothetical protein HPY87_08880 [Fervidobacterium sp.]|uniref:Gp37-like protein n=1 Tax=Fervidobacterium sp. TaxID=1871331 RepID=UPI0025C548D3|nr:hypothetical protein [Fervidobacterium sp.]NPU89974.1 hypothetical protein [Fervidobacterium sp.]